MYLNVNNGFKIGVLNLMGNIFMKKCDDVFKVANKFLKKYSLKKDYDFLVLDFHAEINTGKMAMGHFFDGKANFSCWYSHTCTLLMMVILEKGTAYQTDAGMSGNYNSVMGYNKDILLKNFLKKFKKNFR